LKGKPGILVSAGLSPGEAIRSLNQQLSDPSLKSSTRILMLILLTMNKRMGSSELRALMGLGKGSLENHLEKMEAAGQVTIRKSKSFRGNGMSQTVEVTEKGLRDCKVLLEKIRGLDV
jgi:DNA-binding MarR family transcriptional regulator